MAERHKVVILGGGFGGLVAAQRLKRADADITLIDRRNFHLFQPLMYQVATGSLSPGDIAAPLRGVLSKQKNTQVLLGEATDIDPVAKRITLRDGGAFPYDSLIVATGSQSSYYGNDQWRTWAPSLKSIEEATDIRHKILYAFEEAERAKTPEDVRAWLTFVIVGAGATGMELAGALAEIANETLRNDFRHINPRDARILLIEGGPRVLPSYPPPLSAKAEKLVTKLGVEVLKNVMVTDMNGDGVTFKHGDGKIEQMAAKTVLWAGGIIATPFGKHLAERTQAETDRTGRITVNPDLTVPRFPDIWIVGDLAHFTENGKALPGVAQVAIQGGNYAGRAILARLAGKQGLDKPFHYFNKGDMAVIGRAAAVANIFGIQVSGLLAWLIWLFIHLIYIVEFQSRVMVFIQWGFEYLTFSRGARLITGTAASDVLGPPQPMLSAKDAPITRSADSTR